MSKKVSEKTLEAQKRIIIQKSIIFSTFECKTP